MSPQRIQLSRTKGWRKPEGAIVVARGPGRRWGNPFRVIRVRSGGPGWAVVGNGEHSLSADLDRPWTRREAAEWAVDRFRSTHRPRTFWAHDARIALAGRDLCCWCPLDMPCHADVLLEIVNEVSP